MKSKKLITPLILLGVIFLGGIVLLAGVISKQGATPEIKDGGFLSGEPCSAPCFLGIAPNQTKEAQAIQILKEHGLYKNCDPFDDESESGVRGAVCSAGAVSVAYFRNSDVVGGISFRPSQPISVEMLIEKYGEPDHISVVSDRQTPETQLTSSMALVYDQPYAIIRLGEQVGNTFHLAPTTMVDSVGYMDPAFPSVKEQESIRSTYRSWHGFGEYQDQSSP